MEILEFIWESQKIIKNIRVSFKNNENYEKYIILINNYENHDNPRISREHNETNENLRIPKDNQ